jgi:hypothetical protein
MFENDPRSKEWEQRFSKVWDKGDYRLGSTAQRLIPIVRRYVKEGVVNDYGSGTGRMEVELLRSGAYTIHMVDIAENALEPPAVALLGEKLTFTQASLWDLPMTFAKAPWGLCINVMMTLPAEKVNRALSEIRRTCDNLFFECYDMEDTRLGMQMTTTKGDAAFWKEKLSGFWSRVEQIQSPESKRRYIFICYGE